MTPVYVTAQMISSGEVKKVNILGLDDGDVVFAHGAKFEVTSTEIYDDLMVAHSKWLDGDIIPGYFGPDKGWTFQGNSRVELYILNVK